jgi:hypothetical protein
MKATLSQGPAQVLQFPARGRFAANGHGEPSKSMMSSVAPRVANVASGGAWYHEEAVQEAEQVRKN